MVVLPMLRALVLLGKNIKKSNIDFCFLRSILLIERSLSQTNSYRINLNDRVVFLV
jgi:hypothetical protein